MPVLRAGVLYFAIVFAAGFVLGTIRTLWVVPRVGTRWAELMESPLMLAVTIVAARWIVRRRALPASSVIRLRVGLVGLALLLAAELAFALRIRGLTFSEYIASRDPVSGTVYLALLLLFAVMPLLVGR